MYSKAPYAPFGLTPNKSVLKLTHLYEYLLLLLVALIPMLLIWYIYQFQNPALRFVDYRIHEYVIGIAILQSSFISYVTWRCYLSSGEPLLRWLTLSFLSFTLIYMPHGFFTPFCEQNMALFLLYGPASRLVMASFLLAGLVEYGNPPHDPQQRAKTSFWLAWIGVFLLLDVLVAWVATMPGLALQPVRLSLEISALVLLVCGISLIVIKKLRNYIMIFYAVSLAYLAESSQAFVIAAAWNHMWWLAHFISVCGFTLLSYGVVRAFHSTRSFSLVFSQEEVLEQLAAAKFYAEEVARQLEIANENLKVLAATDPLTGLSNRRHFMIQSQAEFSRAMRTGLPFAVLALDLDHFKHVNDQYGHPAGDEVLKCFASTALAQLRPTDHIGRIGGEEFVILLVDTSEEEALSIAERIRRAVENISVPLDGVVIKVTVSIGLTEFSADCQQLEQLLTAADECLYQAKKQGRNRVVCCSQPLNEDVQ
jgi:diguanylate cyclase (GGDEF)-like protein